MDIIHIENKRLETKEVSPEDKLAGLRLQTIGRFPEYLKLLWELSSLGREVVSPGRIANELSLDSATVRKDLAFTGTTNNAGAGYSIPLLIKGIEKLIRPSNNSEYNNHEKS